MIRSVLGRVTVLGRAAAVASLAVVLFGCPKKGPATDAGVDSAPSSSASATADSGPPPAVTPSNDGAVTHYPDQNAGNGETLTVRYATPARTEASSAGGKLVVELKAETQTEKMADHEGFDLVMWDDPANAGQKLEGWVNHVALSGATAPPAHPSGGGGVTPPAPTTPPPAPASNGYVCLKQNPPGKCPAGFKVFQAVCRVPCSTVNDCHGPTPKCFQGYCYASNGCGND